MAGKHSNSTGRHARPLSTTLRATGGLLAGAAVIGLAAGTTQVAGAVTGDPAQQATLVSGAPLMKGGLPEPAGEDFESKSSSAGTTGSERKAETKTGPKAESKPAQAQARTKPETAPKPGTDAKPGTDPKSATAAEPAEKKPTADDAIALAKKQVGISENRSGKTKFQDWYVKTKRAKETAERDGGRKPSIYGNAAWCSMFISWVGDQIGFSDQLGSDAWTVEHARWFQKQDRWGTRPRPGAIVFFAWNGGKSVTDIRHVGMVVKYKGRGQVETVEGNTSNAVRVRERSTSTIVGYGYPDYAKK